MKNKWSEAFLLQFKAREDIGKEELYEKYFKKFGLGKSEVFECFKFIEDEIGVSVGILRPHDNLSKLTEPPQTGKFLRRFSGKGGAKILKAK
jgi:hypothetical protein